MVWLYHSLVALFPSLGLLQIKLLLTFICLHVSLFGHMPHRPLFLGKLLQNICLTKDLQLEYTKRLQLNKKTIKKWAKYLNRHFTNEDTRMVNKHMERCSIALVTRKIQNKATMKKKSYNEIPPRNS